uniref:Uncharacterized protein n=1 Tax=Timema bartmani TaxID=61472 RepID=A0A7R9EPM4_9NEOP|nr:unnamed protein product [Timema bartmani]
MFAEGKAIVFRFAIFVGLASVVTTIIYYTPSPVRLPGRTAAFGNARWNEINKYKLRKRVGAYVSGPDIDLTHCGGGSTKVRCKGSDPGPNRWEILHHNYRFFPPPDRLWIQTNLLHELLSRHNSSSNIFPTVDPFWLGHVSPVIFNHVSVASLPLWFQDRPLVLLKRRGEVEGIHHVQDIGELDLLLRKLERRRLRRLTPSPPPPPAPTHPPATPSPPTRAPTTPASVAMAPPSATPAPPTSTPVRPCKKIRVVKINDLITI